LWIESYRAGGKRYYRAIVPGGKPIHLGTAAAIVRKIRPERLRSEAETANNPRKPPREPSPKDHEGDIWANNPAS